jgi:hypothetical protein
MPGIVLCIRDTELGKTMHWKIPMEEMDSSQRNLALNV